MAILHFQISNQLNYRSIYFNLTRKRYNLLVSVRKKLWKHNTR